VGRRLSANLIPEAVNVFEAIAAWRAQPRTNRGGQPWYSPLAVLTALTLRAVFHLALRQTEGLIGSLISLLGFDLPLPEAVHPI
jgi:Transposase DDE domain